MGSVTDPYALKSVSDLPVPFRTFFGFRYFNSLQSECFSACFLSDVNMVISAPTGSGKTVLFELCILRLLSRFISAEGRFIHIKGTLKTVYIAPSKALVQEKLRDWNQKLGKLGINCLELTGDNASYNIRNIQEADIIVTTPEKFDAVTRYHFKDGGLSFFSDIALVLIDEVHLLNDPRGAALEAIVSRIKMLSRKPEMKSSALASVRLLAVSATIPNISDLVGFHNGGLCQKDRSLIEGLFLRGDLQVLCTTNTLAHGINLPAHTVMSGRAGRPPFDDTGMVIIMTRRETVHLYENLLSGCEMVESQLLSCMTEHLTAEIVQLTISDITRAIEWMKCSYLYVRMKKNPEKYAINKGFTGDRIEKHVQEPGRLMTKYYLRFNTMKNMMQAPADCSVEAALHIVCRAEEFSWIQLRRNEKKLLSDANTDKDGRLRFHILGEKGKRKKRIQTREEKIFVLANDCLTGDPSLHDLSMNQDMISICSNGCRIAKCMREYFIYRKNYKGALNSSLLAKSLHQKLWDDSPFLLKQLPGIGMVTAKGLHSMGVKTFEALYEADPRKIEIVTGRKYPFGNHIKESLLSLPPKIEMKLEETQCQRQGKFKLVVTLTRLSVAAQSTKRHYADMPVQYLYSGVNASARKDDC
ncbi:Sec63 [Sarracenia purpurea var. burkii]